ncbi:MAG: hypothetical protein M2R45_03043 [Verrucomicrobia subdivision 3 bacterium]|nr:hypothetical protein [Limisphaerales bacterium]MCS1415564.1 hypothetical protein [Limisphaerales bacterium]
MPSKTILITDGGSTGLNLQDASIVVNYDLPWIPAKLEQRSARAWRKNQPNAVTVYKFHPTPWLTSSLRSQSTRRNPTKLEIIDRSTAEVLKRLKDDGIIASTLR